MSALPPKADKRQMSRYVCFVPKADILQCGRNWHYSEQYRGAASYVYESTFTAQSG
jgi:hypothetical protein